LGFAHDFSLFISFFLHCYLFAMNRRGFFSSLFGREPQSFFFGVQVVIETFSTDNLGKRLRTLIAQADNEKKSLEKPAQKQAWFKQFLSIITEHKPHWEYGFWDFHEDEGNNADEMEFESWLGEITASIATESEELGAHIDEAHRLSADKSYIVATIAFVLEYAPQRSVYELLEKIPEEEYWTISGFSELFEALRRVNFEYVLRDAVFVMPGNDDDGFSWEDLHSADWNYLKYLTF
jgi:hypothetical protein